MLQPNARGNMARATRSRCRTWRAESQAAGRAHRERPAGDTSQTHWRDTHLGRSVGRLRKRRHGVMPGASSVLDADTKGTQPLLRREQRCAFSVEKLAQPCPSRRHSTPLQPVQGAMADWAQLEAQDGVRLSWCVLA